MPQTRVQGKAKLLFLCDCPDRPHDYHTILVEVDQVVIEDGRKDMPKKALLDAIGRKRYKEIAELSWEGKPLLTPM